MREDNQHNQQEDNQNRFGLPDDYFQKSAQAILNKVEWEDEHRDYPQLRMLKEGRCFQVPDQYFKKSEAKIEVLLYPGLLNLKKTLPFVTPEDYFEANAHKVFERSGMRPTHEREVFVKLYSLERRNNFQVPKNYFEQKEQTLKNIGQASRQVKVISLVKRSVAYGIAALLLIVLSLWVYQYYYQPAEVKDCGTIACVDKTDLLKTKNLESLDNDQLYELVNPADLEKNLESNKKMPKTSVKPDSGLKDLSADDLLDEI